MSIALGTLAVILAGLGGPNPPGSTGSEITYQFQMFEIHGLEWRAPRGRGLKPVTSRGGVTVWSAPGNFLKSLPEGTVGRPLMAPKLTALEHGTAHVTSRQNQPFVTQASWRGADTPPRETTEQVRDGMAATIRGRRLEQGVLAYLVIEDTNIHSVHTLSIPSPTSAKVTQAASSACSASALTCPVSGATATCDQALTQVGFAPISEPECCASETAKAATCGATKSVTCASTQRSESSTCCGDSKTTSTDQPVQLRIPEIGHGEIAGEWLIPRDEVLLVGFGPHTVADKNGKAVVIERLAVITAEAAEPHPRKVATLSPALPHGMPRIAHSAPVIASTATAGLPMPAVPSRNLPQGIHADGTTAELPPLPEETQVEEPSDGSTEPRPSPQSRRPQVEAETMTTPPPKPEANKDSKTAKASFAFPRGLFRPAGLPTIGLPNLQFMMPLKPFELKLPLNQKLQLELIGKVVPDTDSASEGETEKN